MFEDIQQHRAAVAEQIQKAMEIGFTGNELEKAHKVGDVHPNGKWVWTRLPSGRYDWRVIKKTGAASGGSSPATAQQTAQSGKKEGVSVSANRSVLLNIPGVSRIKDALTTYNSKYTDLSKVKLIKTPKGNWDLHYDGHRLGIIAGSSISEQNAAMMGWIKSDGSPASLSIGSEVKIYSSELEEYYTVVKIGHNCWKIKGNPYPQDNITDKEVQEGLKDTEEEAQKQKSEAKEEKKSDSFQSPKEIADFIAKKFGTKVKRVNGTVTFGNWGDYGAYSVVGDCYEVQIDDTHKIRIGVVNSATKDWMHCHRGEILMQTAVKGSTLSGKKMFQWNRDGLTSYKPGSNFKDYLEKEYVGTFQRKIGEQLYSEEK